jgi:hypothetical protein
MRIDPRFKSINRAYEMIPRPLQNPPSIVVLDGCACPPWNDEGAAFCRRSYD